MRTHGLAIVVALTTTLPSWAAPPPEVPLAELDAAGSKLRIRRDGSLVGPTPQPIAVMSVDGMAPEKAWLRGVSSAGRQLVEAGAFRRGHGRVLLLAVDGANVTQLLDEPIGRSGDGELERHVQIAADGVRRWQSTSAVGRCDARPPLFLERWDLTRRTWEAQPLPVPAAPDLERALPRSKLRVQNTLRFSSASIDGRSDRADYLAAPRELDDGNRTAPLVLGRGPRVVGSFFTAQAPRGVELVALRVDPVPAPYRLPRALVLVGGTPARPLHRLVLGAGGGFAFPPGLKGGCVSLVVDDDGTGAELALTEIALFIGDVGPEALPAHAKAVAEQSADAEDAARALEDAGPNGVNAALDALPGAVPAGRLRLLQVLHHARGHLPESFGPRIGKLLETAHRDERALMRETLASIPAQALAEATRLLGDGTQASEARVDAVELLADREVQKQLGAATVLLGAMSDHDPALARAALRVAMRVAPGIPELAQEALRHTEGGVAPAMVAVLGAAAPALGTEQRAQAAAALGRLGAVEALQFPLAVRVIGALGALDRPAAVKAIGEVLARAQDRTLRLVALDAIPADLDAPTRLLLLSRAAQDADARVRERALQQLVVIAASAGPRAFSSAVDDPWPQVRRAAYRGLGASCAAAAADVAPRLEQRIFDKKAADADPAARAEALSALSHCPSVPIERFTAAAGEKQPAEVREQAAVILGGAGPRALPQVTKALDRTFSHGGAEMPPVAIALLKAVGRIGAAQLGPDGKPAERPYDDDTLTLLRDAAADPFYPGIRIAALAALAAGCPAGAKVVFDRADADPEPAVQRASALSRARCPR